MSFDNCVGEPAFDLDPPRSISFWVRDATTGAAYSGPQHLATEWSGNTCAGQPYVFTPPTTGHVYKIVAIDYTSPGCTDSPQSCVKMEPFSFVADTNGFNVRTSVT